MPAPFDATETGFTKTAGTLANPGPERALSFPKWGNPERDKINAVLSAANLSIYSA